jgi:hypothetical protein
MKPLNKLALKNSLLELIFSLESIKWGVSKNGDHWIEWRNNGVGRVHGPSFESCLQAVLETENASSRSLNTK